MKDGPAYLTLPDRADLLRGIERIDLSAEAKAAIAKLIDLTHAAAGRIMHVGRHIVAFVLDAMRVFPHLTFANLIAATLSLLIAAVPILGPLLSPLLTPLLLAAGVGLGALADFSNGGLGGRIEQFATELRAKIDA